MRHRLPSAPLRFLALLAVAGCGGTDPIVPAERTPTSLSITPDNVIMTFLNQSVQLSARVVDQNDIVMPTPIEWTLSDPSVASVSTNGLITALAIGSSTLTATGLGLSATANVEVVQQISSFVATQGDNQEAIRDSTLADPIIVRVLDQGGSGIPGLAITFAPAAGNGTVTVAAVDTDANGEATTEWTLGSTFGEQELLVTAPGQPLTVKAIARSEVPIPDLTLVGILGLSSLAPSTLETVTATATVKNIGDLASGATRVLVSANGAEVGSADLASLDANDSTEVQIDIGPLSAGSNELVFSADPDDSVVELFESNNAVSRTINVLDQASLTVGVPVTGLSAEIDQELLFRVDVAGPTTLTVSFNAPNGDADLYIAEGARPGFREDYTGCRSTSPISVESCQVPFAEGTYHILVHAWAPEDPDEGAPFSGGTITVTEGEALIPYDIELVFVENGTQSQEDAFIAAAAKWTQIIVADVGDVDYTGVDMAFPADRCMEGQPAFDQILDDVVIFVDIGFIDGQGGTLGQAGPCAVRGAGSNQTMFGRMEFDEADLVQVEAQGQLEGLILHEMGHVLGIGTHWNRAELLRNPSLPDNPGADTHFVGPNALIAFDNIGGGNFVGSKVPVENEAGQGSGDSHWRETTMDTELMTPFLDLLNPLSEVTIASLKDLGYGVDLSQGDNFFLPSVSPPQQAVSGAPGAPGMIDLSNDIWAGPRYVIDKSGRIREILR